MSEEFSIDWPHGHQTRDGRKARIICTDARGEWPIVALVTEEDGQEITTRLTAHGHYHRDTLRHYEDIINAPAPAPDWEKIAASQNMALQSIENRAGLHLKVYGPGGELGAILTVAQDEIRRHADAFKCL